MTGILMKTERKKWQEFPVFGTEIPAILQTLHHQSHLSLCLPMAYQLKFNGRQTGQTGEDKKRVYRHTNTKYGNVQIKNRCTILLYVDVVTCVHHNKNKYKTG